MNLGGTDMGDLGSYQNLVRPIPQTRWTNFKKWFNRELVQLLGETDSQNSVGPILENG